MNIPDEVIDAAEKARVASVQESHLRHRPVYDRPEYQVIAEWARKEALREALADIDAIEVVGPDPGPYEAGVEFAADCIRDILAALPDGATS